MTREGRRVMEIEHVGSAHTDAELALLVQAARERMVPEGQDALNLGPVTQKPVRVDEIADWTRPPDSLPVAAEGGGGRPRQVAAGGRVIATASLTLWQVLSDAYDQLGFDVVGDDAFRELVAARIIEPTSKLDTIRVLDEIGVGRPGLATLYRCLRRTNERDYRDQLARG